MEPKTRHTKNSRRDQNFKSVNIKYTRLTQKKLNQGWIIATDFGTEVVEHNGEMTAHVFDLIE